MLMLHKLTLLVLALYNITFSSFHNEVEARRRNRAVATTDNIEDEDGEVDDNLL